MSRNFTDGGGRTRLVRMDDPVERIERAGAGRETVEVNDAERFRLWVETWIPPTTEDTDDELDEVRCMALGHELSSSSSS